MKEKVSKLIRTITVPPVLALAMLLILRYVFGDRFAPVPVLVGTILFLAVVPACAYPAAALKKESAAETRQRQRKLAFVFNLLGYVGAMIFGIAMQCGQMLRTILISYLAAVLILTLLNKGFHIKASGHACSCVLPYLFLAYWLGVKVIIPCVLLYAAELWASVVLKRHTVKEFLLGSMAALFTFVCVGVPML